MERKDGKNRIWRWILRITLSIACAAMLTFIFFNSAQTGEQSGATSSAVTDAVQDAVSVIAPQSPIATATGAEYDKLHSAIRTLAHFSEFALLGALLCWCCLSYTDEKLYMVFPVCGVFLVPIADEFSQTFSIGRGAELKDVLTDTLGGVAGIVAAILFVALFRYIYRRVRARKTRKKE